MDFNIHLGTLTFLLAKSLTEGEPGHKAVVLCPSAAGFSLGCEHEI